MLFTKPRSTTVSMFNPPAPSVMAGRNIPSASSNLGQRQVRFRSRRVGQLGHLSFYADRGLIHIIDERNGAYACVRRQEVIVRMLALRKQLGNCTYEDEYRELRQAVERLVDVVKQAQRQGDPAPTLTPAEFAAAKARAFAHFYRTRQAPAASRLILPSSFARTGPVSF